MTFNTGNTIGSADARDRSDNSENLDLAVNSLSPTFVDRLGVTRDTLEGIYQKSAYYCVGTFEAGYTLTNNRQTLAYGNVEYSWSGAFPKVVSAGSTPATSGGVGAGAWVDRTSETLRDDIAGNGLAIEELSNIKTKGQEYIQYNPDLDESGFNPLSIHIRLKREWGIKDWGMSGTNRATDDWQKATNMLTDIGYIKLRHGQRINLQSPLVLEKGQDIIGDSRNGCIVAKDHTGNGIVAPGYNEIRGFRFTHPYQTLTGSPVEDSGACISMSGAYNRLHGLSLGNCWEGIDASNGLIGGEIKDIIGLPYFKGISVDAGYDLIHWHNIHFNPNLYGLNAANNASVLNFIYQNAIAFDIRRQDWGEIVGAFCYGYKRMFSLDNSIVATGAPNNIDFIGCRGDGVGAFMYAPNHSGFNILGGHWTTFNPWGSDPTDYSAANLLGSAAKVNVYGLRSSRCRGYAFDVRCPTRFHGVTAFDVMHGITNSAYVGEIFQFSNNAAGSSIENFEGSVYSVNAGVSRGMLLNCEDVTIDNFIAGNIAQKIQIGSGSRYKMDGLIYAPTTKRPSTTTTRMLRQLGMDMWDTDLAKRITYVGSGVWHDATSTPV